MTREIDILVVEPGKNPRPVKVEDTLEAFQKIVGGPIEAGCYLPQRVMLICNSEGKNLRLMPNRENPTAFCERTVEVLPIGDIAFSLPEYGYTDTSADVALLREKGLDGAVAWTLEKDGEPHPVPENFTEDGGALALPETGTYTLTATLTDAAGKKYAVSQTTTILPVLVPTVTASADKVHEDETVEISLTAEGGYPAAVRWEMVCDGEEIPAALSDQGGTLAFDGAGDYVLTAIAVDAQGREFSSEPVSIHVIENLSLSLTADAEKVHEDETTAISLTVEHGTPSTVEWALTHDSEGVSVSLDDNGGTLAFEGIGDYVLTATVTDELGKTFTEELTIQVYPLIVLTLDVSENTHVDQPATVSLTGTDLEVTWEVASEAGEMIDTDLTNEGGEIAFPSVGTYTVTASVTDELGRAFSTSETIHVWTTMRLSFRLPEFAHTDETVVVRMTSAEPERPHLLHHRAYRYPGRAQRRYYPCRGCGDSLPATDCGGQGRLWYEHQPVQGRFL